MLALFSSGTELRRFTKGVMPKLAIGILLFIPLLSGALYLWAFWAPTDHLDRLDIALVNEDEGADNDGERLTAGQEVVDELLDGGDLGWHLTDAADAASGVADGTYYFSVTLPKDFSSAIVSPSTDDPTSAKIEVNYNDANSFLASTLGKSAMLQVRAAVAEKIGDEQITTVLNGVQEASDGFATASDGAGKLKDGASQLTDGSESMSVGLDDLLDGMNQLQDGTDSLVSGAGKLTSGSKKVTNGLESATDGATSLKSGTKQLASGSSDLSNGLDQVYTAVTKDGGLADGTAQLSDGLSQLKAAITKDDTGLADGAKSLSAGASAVSDGVNDVVEQVTDSGANLQQAVAVLGSIDTSGLSATDAAKLNGVISGISSSLGEIDTDGLAQLKAGASSLASGASALNSGVNGDDGLVSSVKQLASGAAKIDTGVNTGTKKTPSLVASLKSLNSGSSTLATGLSDASDGATSLTKGLTKLTDGSSQVTKGLTSATSGAKQLSSGLDSATDGVTQLSDGSEQLTDGASQLTDGSEELQSKLSDAADQSNIGDEAKIATTATTLSDPVELDQTYVHEAEGFGEGFAPFFISLALFVGGIITWLLLHALPRRALAAGVGGIRSVMAGFLPAAAFALGQVLIMMGVLFVGLDLQANHVLGTILFTFFAALTFFAMQQMFIITLGSAAGRVVSLALLMFQLSSSGGTYPVPTTPQFFQDISPWMPMTYVVTGLRHLITGSVDHRFWLSFTVLLGVFVVSLAISAFTASRQRVWNIPRLHPELSL